VKAAAAGVPGDRNPGSPGTSACWGRGYRGYYRLADERSLARHDTSWAHPSTPPITTARLKRLTEAPAAVSPGCRAPKDCAGLLRGIRAAAFSLRAPGFRGPGRSCGDRLSHTRAGRRARRCCGSGYPLCSSSRNCGNRPVKPAHLGIARGSSPGWMPAAITLTFASPRLSLGPGPQATGNAGRRNKTSWGEPKRFPRAPHGEQASPAGCSGCRFLPRSPRRRPRPALYA